MKFNFGDVDTHVTSVNGAITGMETNAGQLQTISESLLQTFAGSGSQGYDEVHTKLMSALTEHRANLTALKGAIATTSGSGGNVHTTDISNGNKFLSI